MNCEVGAGIGRRASGVSWSLDGTGKRLWAASAVTVGVDVLRLGIYGCSEWRGELGVTAER